MPASGYLRPHGVLIRCVIAAALALQLGCGGPAEAPRVAPNPTPAEPGQPPPGDAPSADELAEPEPPPRVPAPPGWVAPTPPHASGCAPAEPCIDVYLGLPKALGSERVVERSALNERLAELARTSSPDAPVETPELPLDELRTILTDGLALKGLLPKADPAVTVASSFTSDGVTVQRLLLEDPLLGTMDAAIARAPEPKGTVLALHGHGGTEDEILIQQGALKLAKAGWTVLAPRFRAYQDGAAESDAAWHLLEHGRTLMGVEVGEFLRWLRWLRTQHTTAPAVLGHSGGAGIALFGTVLDPDVRVVVVDGAPQLTNWSEQGIADETLPDLVPHRWTITTLNRPFVPTRALMDELSPASIPAVLEALADPTAPAPEPEAAPDPETAPEPVAE